MLGIAALGGLWYFLATIGLRATAPAERAAPAVTTLTAGQYKVASEIAALEEAAAAPDAPESERVAALERALQKQRALNAAVAEIGRDQEERLERLERARATLALQATQAKLESVWQQAEAAAASGREAEALKGWRVAFKLQQQLNRSGAEARLKDFARELQLAQRIERADLAPLVETVHAADARVAKATAAEEWEKVAQALTDARAAQLTINQNFPRAPEANLGAVARYESELARFAERAKRAESEVRETGADAAAAARRWDDASAWYAEAQALQRELNERAPQSRFASAERGEELERKKQTALSAKAIAEVRTLDGEAAALLRKRQTYAASERVAAALAKLAEVEANWPKSGQVDEALKLKLGFLQHQQEKLRGWQDEIYARLLPMSQRDGGWVLRGPVEQPLYAGVMTANPSRQRDEARPVESLTWNEAQEFCQRVSWMLGANVRLPTAAELEAMVQNGNGGATAGEELYAQRGGVAEWLQADLNAVEAPVREMEESARVRLTEKKSRAADRGFRFVVELPRG